MAARGWKVFPVNGKVPATLHGLNDASGQEDTIAKWWTRWPDHGIGVATGEASGFWVIDLDSVEARDAFAALQAENGDLPHTVAAKTGKGWHVYWQMPEGVSIRNSASKIAPGVDVRGTGGYVVAPPSIHPSGGRYGWIAGRDPDSVEIAQPPDWLLRIVQAPERPDRVAPSVDGETISEGGRNHVLTSLAGTMRRRGMARPAILAALHEENRLKCDPPLGDEEVQRIAESVSRYEPTAPPSPNGNGHHKTTERRQLQVVGWDVLERIRDEKLQPIEAIPTPWPAWNKACRGAGGGVGLARGWHVVVGAPSGAGKSLVAANMAAHAIQAGVDVCLFSLEMSQLENVTRILAILTEEDVRALEHGQSFDRGRWDRAAERLLEQPGTLRTNEDPLHTMDQVREAMVHHASEGCRLMIVDYLQLAWVGNADTLYHQITEVSHTIRGLAKELRVTTVGLSQVNRRTSSGADKLQKEGLMGGSSLENDAEQVVLVGKPERKYDGLMSTVRLDKNRHGPVSEWGLRLNTTSLKMMELELDP